MAHERAAGVTSVIDTLYIPLYFRALESKRGNPLVMDRDASALIAALPFDFSRFRPAAIDVAFTLLRTRQFDRIAEAFVACHADACIVEIGCGLNNRRRRMPAAPAAWFDLDLPEVIGIRDRLLPGADACATIGTSVLDFTWMDRVVRDASASYLFLAEGVLPYLPERENRRLLLELARRFPGAEIAFDAISPIIVKVNRLKHNTSAAARLVQWMPAGDTEPESWQTGIRLLSRWDYFSQPEPRLGAARLMKLVPAIARGARVLRYRLGSGQARRGA